MAYFGELSTITSKLIDLILKNQDLCKLIYYNEPNPLSQPTISSTRSALLLKQLFPMPKKAPAETEQTTIVNVHLMRAELTDKNKGFADEYVAIDVMTHLEKWMIDDGKIRTYEIVNRIDNMLNNQYLSGYSMNYILLTDIKEIMYSDYFYGYRLVYKFTNNSNVAPR